MTYYNLTNVTDGGGLVSLFAATNELTGGWFWLFSTIALFIVMIISLSYRGILPAVAVSSFVTGIAGILFVLTGLIHSSYLIYYIIVMGLAVAAIFVAGKGE